MQRTRTFLILMGVVGLMASGCVLDPNSDCPDGDCSSDLSIGCFDSQGNPISCDLSAPCDYSPVDGVTDCVAPAECRNAANDGDPVCLDDIGTTCRQWDPSNICAVPPVCGDGNLDPGEVCDDGNTADCDGCRGDCSAVETGCGDGFLCGAEECDDAGESATCDANCTFVSCGDGDVNATAGEECDDAGESATCDANCTLVSCGDGDVNTTAGEECDDAGESATCDADCTLVSCGDGVTNITAGEECDDAGESATCDADCTTVVCGDNVQNITAGEVCDDGNNTSGDGCSADCLSDESCGNGILDAAAGEECDDGNTTDGDGCDSMCILEDCGNGTLDPGEDCDGGADCDASCACPANYYQDGLTPPGCAPCDVGGVCQAPTSNYCANVPACWSSAVRVALPNGGTIYVRTGAGLEFPEVVPAGQYRDIGLLVTDLGAQMWCSTNAMSVDTVFPSGFPSFPPLPGVWLPGAVWPTVPGGPASMTDAPEFNVTSQADAYWTVAQ